MVLPIKEGFSVSRLVCQRVRIASYWFVLYIILAYICACACAHVDRWNDMHVYMPACIFASSVMVENLLTQGVVACGPKPWWLILDFRFETTCKVSVTERISALAIASSGSQMLGAGGTVTNRFLWDTQVFTCACVRWCHCQDIWCIQVEYANVQHVGILQRACEGGWGRMGFHL